MKNNTMWKQITIAGLGISLLAAALPVLAQAGGIGGRSVTPSETALANARLEQLRKLADQIADRESQLRVLLTTRGERSPEVQKAQEELDALKAQFAKLQAEQRTLEEQRLAVYRARIAPLLQPVDIQLRDATVQQTAEALSRATGVPMHADQDVPQDRRLTLQVRGVPLGTVLEAIGNQAQLMIAPDQNGVALRSWPTLKVNDQEEMMVGKLAPWSDEWATIAPGAFPSPNALPGGGGFGGGLGGGNRVFEPARAAEAGTPSDTTVEASARGRSGGFGGFGQVAAAPYRLNSSSPLTVTPLPNGNIAVAVMGNGPGSEGMGVWLFLYRLEGGTLRQIASTFSRPGPVAATSGGRSGAGGLPRASPFGRGFPAGGGGAFDPYAGGGAPPAALPSASPFGAGAPTSTAPAPAPGSSKAKAGPKDRPKR